METSEKIKKSWWVIFPFTFLFPGLGFIYIGLKASNRNWILEGITYELPWFFYFLASAKFSFDVMSGYYVWIILLVVFIALIRSIMVAIKLLDVYEKGEPVAEVYSTPGSRSIPKPGSDEDNNWKTCCACIVFIFIIFAIASIL
jgi:hypothetical protein